MKTFGWNLQDFYKQNDELAYEIYLSKKKQEELEQYDLEQQNQPKEIKNKRKKILGIL